MAKSRRLTLENNRKMTDFFVQQPSSSLRAPPSSPPVFGSSAKRFSSQHSESRKTSLSQTQPLMQVQPNLVTKPPASPLRSVKKENAPPVPLARSRVQLPSERDVTYISSSSDAQTHISISSTSMRSVGSNVVEVVPPVRRDRRQVQKNIASSSSPLSSQKRCFSRSQTTVKRSKRSDKQGIVHQPRKPTQKKRKKPEGVQSDDGDVLDLEAMEEVIYVSSKPAHIDLLTPEPSERSRPTASRKRTCTNLNQLPDASSEAVDVIPSSQSDEQELSIPKKERRNMQEIADSVREWQLNSSQSTVPLGSGDSFEITYDDPGMPIDMDYSFGPSRPRDRSKTPTSSARTQSNLSQVTPRKISPVKTPRTSSRRATSSPPPGSFGIPERPSSPSPVAISLASSLTKVNTPVRMSPKKSGTPRSSPSKKSPIKSPVRSLPRSTGSRMDVDAPLLNQNEKTDAIVERIKAEARAKAMAMPDDDTMILGSLDDSDSELGSPSGFLTELVKDRSSSEAVRAGGSKTMQQVLGEGCGSLHSDSDETDDRLGNIRRSNRRSLSTSSSSVATRIRRAPNMLPTMLTKPTLVKPKKSVNPFAKLRKEKARRDRIAEMIASPPGIDSDVNLSDAAEGDFRLGSGSPLRRQNSDEGDFETAVREADRLKVFDEDDASALGKILENDRKDRRKGKEISTGLGIPFWQARECAASSTDIPRLEIATKNSSAELIREAVATKDVEGLALVLQSGLLVIEDMGYMGWLFEVATCTSGSLADAAHTALEHASRSWSKEITISSSPVVKALARMGARQDHLEALHVQLPSCCNWIVTEEQRPEALWKLSEAVRLFASEAMLHSEDVPSLFGLLVAIGIDIRTDFNLKLSIKHTLRTLIKVYCGAFSDERGELEVNICSRVLGLIPGLNAANKAHLLSFIDGEDVMSRRIGQWIAFAMLAGDYGVQQAKLVVTGPPSLVDIIALLDPHLESDLRSDIFNTSRNSEHFDTLDYAALTSHVEVLGRVLMNIPQYVLLERKEAKEKQNNSDSPRRLKDMPKLEIIKALLERLGNNIADTRAAHLDRSHAKAVIQQLAMRVHYQRKAATSERPKLDNYFGRTRPS